jgi:uncharacterized protein (TIRG00374 family)
LTTWLKVGVSIALLAYVVAASRPERIAHALAHADARLVAAGALLWFVIQLLNVYKWSLLNRAQGFDVPFGRLLDVYYVGMFFNTFLPSGFGGDAVRTYQLSRLSGRVGGSMASVGVDRFTSLWALLLVATATLVLAPPAWRLVPLWAVGALNVGGLVLFALLLHGRWLGAIARWRGLARWPRVGMALSELATDLMALRSAGVTLAVALAISIVYQLLAVVLHWMLMGALGLAVPFGYAAVFVPILTLAASMPVSINGLGVREGGYAFFLGKLGIGVGEAVSVGLLSLLMLLLSAGWGAVCYARSRRASTEVRHDPIG